MRAYLNMPDDPSEAGKNDRHPSAPGRLPPGQKPWDRARVIDTLMVAEKTSRFHRQAVHALTRLRNAGNDWTIRTWKSVSPREIGEFYKRRLERSPDSVLWFMGLTETIESLASVREDLTLVHCCQDAASFVLIIGENSNQLVGLIVFDPLQRYPYRRS